MESPKHDAQQQLLKAIEAATVPLTAMALLGLADEFYTKEERQTLYAELHALQLAEAVAFDAELPEPIVEPALSFEDRVKKYGPEEADRHIEPRTLGLQARLSASRELRAFEHAHPLIKRLLTARYKTGRHANENG